MAYRFYPPLTISQQYKDVKEKAEQLIPWLNKLTVILAVATDGVDPEEEERRSELTK